MKLSLALALALCLPGKFVQAQEIGLFGTPISSAAPAEVAERRLSGHSERGIPGWGQATNPAGDCQFFRNGRSLLLSVPGGKPHDLAAEIGVTNAPRVLQPVTGEFVCQVRVEGRFSPGGESTQPGRTAYNGAGLVLMADAQNVICLARAVLQRAPGGEPQPYANFEIRSEGKLQRIGSTGDHALPSKGPVFLRLERRGSHVLGAVSTDGKTWEELAPKDLPPSWPARLQVGVVGISTSTEEFNPRFSQFQLLK